MNFIPLWLVLSLSAAILFGIGQTFVKKGFDEITPLWTSIISSAIGFFISIPAALILSGLHINIPTPLIALNIFITTATYLSFYYVISKGEIALTGTIFGMYPISAIILSVIFLNERLVPLQYFGIVLTLFGGLLVALPERNVPKVVKDYSWVRWGIFGAIIAGIGDFLSKITTNAIGSYSNIFYEAFIFIILLVFLYVLDKKGRKHPRMAFSAYIPTFIGSVIIAMGAVAFQVSFDHGPASLVVPVSSVSPAFVAIFAVTFLKEKITKKQLAGIVSIVSGILLIGFGG